MVNALTIHKLNVSLFFESNTFVQFLRIMSSFILNDLLSVWGGGGAYYNTDIIIFLLLCAVWTVLSLFIQVFTQIL